MKIYDFTNGDTIDIKKLLEDRAPTSYGEYEETVLDIVNDVRKKIKQKLSLITQQGLIKFN